MTSSSESRRQPAEGQPVPHLGGQVAQVADLLPGQAARAQLRVGGARDLLGTRPAAAVEPADAAGDGGRGLARDLLVEDRLQEVGEGPQAPLDLEPTGADLRDDPTQHGIGHAQVAGGAPTIGGSEAPRLHGRMMPHSRGLVLVSRHRRPRHRHSHRSPEPTRARGPLPDAPQGRAAPARGRLHPRRGDLGAHAAEPPEPRGHAGRDAPPAGDPGERGGDAPRLSRQDALPALDHAVLREHRPGDGVDRGRGRASGGGHAGAALLARHPHLRRPHPAPVDPRRPLGHEPGEEAAAAA